MGRKKQGGAPHAFFLLKTYSNGNTRKTLQSLWSNWVSPVIVLPAVTTKSPEESVQFWLENDLKPATIKKCLYLYKKWHDVNGLDVNISGAIKSVSCMEENPGIKAWTKEEAVKALNVAKLDDELYNMILVTLHTGMRKGELFRMVWEDVDFIKGKIYIRRTKTGKPRSIPMSVAVEEVLQSCYGVGMPQNQSCFRICEPNPRLKKLCEMADVRPITWHGLRHTFATLALEAGRSPREVAEVLGHTKVSTTLNLYWQITGRAMDLDFLPG